MGALCTIYLEFWSYFKIKSFQKREGEKGHTHMYGNFWMDTSKLKDVNQWGGEEDEEKEPLSLQWSF